MQHGSPEIVKVGAHVLTADARRGTVVPGRIAGATSVCVQMQLVPRSIELHDESSLRPVLHADAMRADTARGNVALESEGLADYLRRHVSALRGNRRRVVLDSVAYCERVTVAACTDETFDADSWRVWLDDSRAAAIAAIENR